MRLLRTCDLELKDLPPDQIPPYAILSHTWGNDEVLYADMRSGIAQSKAGYSKLEKSCEQAEADGYEYIWVDTCCIDKSSSAELSEAINSMYKWYKSAEICYAYLGDVPTDVHIWMESSSFTRCRWFKRGWTLQELIASSEVVFYSEEWTDIGRKSTLRRVLADITGINERILAGEMNLSETSLANRMSWAAYRVTTRIEDVAYSLMGIFDVNMPLLYGEGEKAFIRLQEEILKYSDDESLFAWIDENAHTEQNHGLLARSPANFAKTGTVIPCPDLERSEPFSISNKGLRIDLKLSPDKNMYRAALKCLLPPRYEAFTGIYLKQLPTGHRQFARFKAQALCEITSPGNLQTVYVRQTTAGPGSQDVYPLHAFQLRTGPMRDSGFQLASTIPPYDYYSVPTIDPAPIQFPFAYSQAWERAGSPRTFKIIKANSRLAGALFYEPTVSHQNMLAVMLGSTTSFMVGFDAISLPESRTVEALQPFYKPQRIGTAKVVGNCRVRVDAQQMVDLNKKEATKYYLIDVNIQKQLESLPPKSAAGIPMPPPPDSKSDARPPAKEAPMSGLRKLKLAFGTPRG